MCVFSDVTIRLDVSGSAVSTDAPASTPNDADEGSSALHLDTARSPSQWQIGVNHFRWHSVALANSRPDLPQKRPTKAAGNSVESLQPPFSSTMLGGPQIGLSCFLLFPLVGRGNTCSMPQSRSPKMRPLTKEHRLGFAENVIRFILEPAFTNYPRQLLL